MKKSFYRKNQYLLGDNEQNEQKMSMTVFSE